MSPPRSRRSVLRALATGGSFLVAGCTADSGSTPTETDTPTATERPPPTTGDPYPDVDERETATPPGSPVLDPSGEWTTFRFDAGNTGYDPDGNGLRDAERYWRLNAGRPPVLDGETLFNVHGRGRDARYLTRRDSSTAEVRAETRLAGYGVNSPPTIDDGRVFVNTFIEVFSLAADRDEVSWESPEMDGIQGAPTVHDGVVFVNSGGFDAVSPHLRAFDAETGAERWRYDTGSESKSTPAVGAGAAFVGSRDGLHAIEASTGRNRFVLAEAANPGGTAAYAGGTVYVFASDEAGGGLLAVDASDGTVRWRVPAVGRGGQPPVVADDLVYAGTGEEIVAFDAADGSRTASFGWPGVPVARAGDVLYAIGNGTVAALDAESDDLLWSYRTEEVQVYDTVGRTVFGVTPVDGAVYVSARDGFHGFGPPRD